MNWFLVLINIDRYPLCQWATVLQAQLTAFSGCQPLLSNQRSKRRATVKIGNRSLVARILSSHAIWNGIIQSSSQTHCWAIMSKRSVLIDRSSLCTSEWRCHDKHSNHIIFHSRLPYCDVDVMCSICVWFQDAMDSCISDIWSASAIIGAVLCLSVSNLNCFDCLVAIRSEGKMHRAYICWTIFVLQKSQRNQRSTHSFISILIPIQHVRRRQISRRQGRTRQEGRRQGTIAFGTRWTWSVTEPMQTSVVTHSSQSAPNGQSTSHNSRSR